MRLNHHLIAQFIFLGIDAFCLGLVMLNETGVESRSAKRDEVCGVMEEVVVEEVKVKKPRKKKVTSKSAVK